MYNIKITFFDILVECTCIAMILTLCFLFVNDKLLIGIFLCPFDVFYRSTRFCLLRVIRNIVLAPLYKVSKLLLLISF